jgi:hypothetical protein
MRTSATLLSVGYTIFENLQPRISKWVYRKSPSGAIDGHVTLQRVLMIWRVYPWFAAAQRCDRSEP